MSDREWRILLASMKQMDERDLTDEARWWASDEAELASMPTNVGEWKASMEVSFAAGQQWALLTAAKRSL